MSGGSTIPIPQNSLFAFEPAKQGASTEQSKFGAIGARRTLDGPTAPRIEIFAGPKTSLKTYSDPRTGCCSYLWGLASHVSLSDAQLLPRCTEAILQGKAELLREVLGTYLLIIDDRQNKRVFFATDVLGIRPWFVTTHENRLIGGSDVWSLARVDQNPLRVNYDSVASWLKFGYNCTGGSLFADYRRLSPGSVKTWETGRLTEHSYMRYESGDRTAPPTAMAQQIHERVSTSFDASVKGLSEATLALSGGFDSRYLAALAARNPSLHLSAYVVCDDPTEAIAARQVANALKIPLEVIPTDGTAWGMFDDPYHWMADGFPVTRQLSHVIAVWRPNVPVLNGYLGDSLVRGSHDRCFGKLDRDTPEDLATVVQRTHSLVGNRFDLLNPHLVQQIERRSLSAMRSLIERGSVLGKPFLYFDLFGRQRHYISNNFLQHLDFAEAVVPFYNPRLIADRFAYDYTCFNWELYELLLRKEFPAIGDIPHSAKLPDSNKQRRISSASRKWATHLLTALARPGTLSIVSRRKAAPRLIGAAAGRSDVENVAVFLQRLWLLETQLQRARISFQWNEI